MRSRKFSIHFFVMLGMMLGIVAGFVIGPPMDRVAFMGTLWVNMMKISLAWMIFFLIVRSIGTQKENSSVSFIAISIVIYYLATTFLASCMGILAAKLTRVGLGFQISAGETLEAPAMESVTFSTFLLNLVPDNFIKPFADGSMMQVLFLGILLGVAVRLLPENKWRMVCLAVTEGGMALFNQVIRLCMYVAPVGVFCSVSAMVGTQGGSALRSVAGFVGTLVLGVVLQVLLVYCGMLLALRLNPITFLKRMIPSIMMALSTESSVLVIPDNLNVASQYGVEDEISNFTIPFGAVFNLDGAGVFLSCVILFAARASGITLSLGTLLYMAVLGTLLSSSGGGIVGGALVKCMILCELFHVPSAVITMVAGVFLLLDAPITACNITGDMVGTLLVSRLNKKRLGKVGKKRG